MNFLPDLPDVVLSPTWNWLLFLNAAIKNTPTDEQAREAQRRAADWPTCACGELCKNIPRTLNGAPEDGALRRLGAGFYYHVRKQEWESAFFAFKSIEERTQTLLLKPPPDQFPPVIIFEE